MADLGSWSTDLETGEESWSPGLYRIFGVDPATTPAGHATHTALIHPDDRDGVRDVLARATLDGEPFDITYRLIRPDGVERVMHGRGAAAERIDGELRRVWGTTQDVTERHRLEAGRREAERRFRAAFEHAPIGVCVLDFHGDDPGQWLTVNPALARLLGYEREALLANASARSSIPRSWTSPASASPRWSPARRSGSRRVPDGARRRPGRLDAGDRRRRARRGRPARLRDRPDPRHHRAQALRGPTPIPRRPRRAHRAVQPPPLRGGARPRAGLRRALPPSRRGARPRPRRLQARQRHARPSGRRRADRPAGGDPARRAARVRRHRPPRRRRVRRDPAGGHRRRGGRGRRQAAARGRARRRRRRQHRPRARHRVGRAGAVRRRRRPSRRGAARRGRHRDVRRQGGRPQPRRDRRARGGRPGPPRLAPLLAGAHPHRAGRGSLRAARPADRGARRDDDSPPVPLRVADPDARRLRRAGPARDVPADRRALRPDRGHRPLGRRTRGRARPRAHDAGARSRCRST